MTFCQKFAAKPLNIYFFKEKAHMNFSNYVKDTLLEKIKEVSLTPYLYCKNPESDFTRNRKLNFEEMLKIIVMMEGGSIKKELLDYFEFDEATPTTSAFIQQRSKIKSDAFAAIFHKFTGALTKNKLYKGYQLLACDGSNLNTASNPLDTTYHFDPIAGNRTFNMTHINALYDLLNRNYIDATVESGYDIDERDALKTMIQRYQSDTPHIVICDRGYTSYDLIAFSKEHNMNFVYRSKESNVISLLKGMGLEYKTDFDYEIDITLTYRQTKEIMENPSLYKSINKKNFSYFNEDGFYQINFRVVRISIGDGLYEYIITNLCSEEFDAKTLKELYHIRWGIETSFRELKYSIGLVNLHTKKAEHIEQEIFAKLTLYNFCSLITMHVVIEQKECKHAYQLNIATAIFICKFFLRFRGDLESPPTIVKLIQKQLLPVRKDRNYKRKLHSKPPVSFIYRIN